MLMGHFCPTHGYEICDIQSCVAELWALRNGLNLCISMFCPAVIVELDALLIVNMLSGDYSTARHLLPLVDDCRALLNRIPHHQVKHCYREANSMADALASCGAKMDNDFVVFDSPPAFVLSFLAQDAANSVYLRRCRGSAHTLGF